MAGDAVDSVTDHEDNDDDNVDDKTEGEGGAHC